MENTIEEVVKKLKAPFPLSEIKWKPQAVSRDKTKAMAVPFIDARAVMERLDEVVGVFNWQVKHLPNESTIGIKNPETNEWVWKGDVGYVAGEESENEDTQAMGVKGSASDGLKRAGVVWGIFRYSYDVPKQWVKWDAEGRKFMESPTLPQWALPAPKNVAPANSNSATRPIGATNTQQTAPMTNTDKTAAENAKVSEKAKQAQKTERTHPPLSPVQKNKLVELVKLTGDETSEEKALQKLDALFVAAYKHGLENATYEEGARLTGELLTQARAKADNFTVTAGTKPTPPVSPTPQPIKAPHIKNLAEWKKIVDWAVEQKFIPNATSQTELFRITDKAGIQTIDDKNIQQVKQLVYDAVTKSKEA